MLRQVENLFPKEKKGLFEKMYIGDQEREDKTQNNSQHYQNGSLF